MNSTTFPSRVSTVLLAGLLALAAVLSDPRPAGAQEACPRPAGATAVAPPEVTAADVENGTGALADFALAARERSREHARDAAGTEQGLYIACLIRQEDGVWRSGSTYLVSLTPDGRVFIHARSMALSGRLLDPRIYAAILVALGVSPADLAGLASTDAATQGAALARVMATLSREPNAAFDATAIAPGASGYASVYVSAELGAPIVLLAGFDIGESHLAAETIDYGNPTVTARDVVDRATLKAFVTQAGEYFLDLQQRGDAAAASQARIALRDPNGPWRHGSVYLYVLDTVSNMIAFHAAFPDRLEYRPLTPTVRDAVTGRFILTEIINAAKSSSDGGFVEYYYDDPTDDTDSADIPKTGYARAFAGEVRRPDGSVQPVSFIVGSGFYGSRTPVAEADPNRAVEAVLPQVMRAMTAGTVEAISNRVRQASPGSPPDRKASLGGASKISDVLMANRQALENGTFEIDRLLGRSSFTLPLGAAGAGGGGLLRDLTVWGSGDWRGFSGGDRRNASYDGNVAGASLGIDTRLSPRLLAGVSVARARGSVDYTAANASKDELTATLTGVNPYVGWQGPGGTNLWATAGYGTGEVEIEDAAGTETGDLTQQMIAGGLDVPVVTGDGQIEDGIVRLGLRAETAFTWAEVEASGTLARAELSASRQRLTMEGSYIRTLASGGTFTPSVEIGMRNDGGDGETGTSVEAGGALRYADPAAGLSIEARARTLLVHSEDYEEWGLGGLVRIDPSREGRGLSLSVQPAWGRTASGVERLWETGVAGRTSPSYRAAGRMDAEIGYGVAASGGLGTVTPWAGVGLAGEGARSWRAGTRWEVAPGARLSLAGAWREAAGHSAPEHGLKLNGAFCW